MHYYQVIYKDEFLGIATSENLRRYQQKHGILLVCDESEAQYIELDSGVYHAAWMWKETVPGLYPTADVTEIDEETYKKYEESIEAGTDPEIQEQVTEDEAIDTIETSDDENTIQVTIEYLRNLKAEQMSNECQKVIQNGFDVQLADGKTYHFSLTAQDQLNFITLISMVQSGATMVPYHADGLLCQYFSAADIITITNQATQFKAYHTTYYNSLKHYIQSLETVDEIREIYYGIAIPEEFQGDVLRSLLGGTSNETAV